MTVRDTLTAIARDLRVEHALHGYATTIEAVVKTLEYQERLNAKTRHPDLAGFGSASTRKADAGAAAATLPAYSSPTMELRFLRRVSGAKEWREDGVPIASRMMNILQQRWLGISPDGQPMYEWRDVPMVEEGEQ
jgi:hypothetical protein